MMAVQETPNAKPSDFGRKFRRRRIALDSRRLASNFGSPDSSYEPL